jgi:hypothetical protein
MFSDKQPHTAFLQDEMLPPLKLETFSALHSFRMINQRYMESRILGIAVDLHFALFENKK